MMILERGALLNNRYRIVEILGQGGMGSVYRAVDENLGVEVAVKDNLFTTDEYARQFRREAVILASLRHPNLPRVTDHFVIENQGQYLVMDYIEGEDLRQRMDRLGLLSEEEVIIIGAALCDALIYLSTRNPSIVHRDIKPGNVKITPNGQIFLVDFGLAKIIQGSQATTTGARAMTPGYSPPEQYGTARTDQRSDIFSLGATLYAALTGSIPEDALARAMDQTSLTSIRKFNSNISRRLAGVIEKALEVRPDDRYQTADEFKQALLSVRNLRRKTGEYTVDPPPQISEKLLNLEDDLPPAAVEIGANSHERTPLPLMISTPIEEQPPLAPSKPRRKGRRLRSCLALLLVGLVVLAGGGAAAYLVNPTLTAQALAWILPSPAPQKTQPAAAQPAATDTPSATPSPTPTETRGVAAAGSQPVPSATPRPARTAEPTITLTPEPTAVGGGAGQIAFASDRITGVPQIYILNEDGSNLQKITEMPEGACQPNWSPDGMRLVFTSPCQGNQQTYPGSSLYIINVDGTELTPLTNVPGGDFDPAWSPDGRQIVFTSMRNSGRPRIYLYNLETMETVRLSSLYSRDQQPSWTPDGEKIVFINSKGSSQVWIMNPDGSDQQQLTRSGAVTNMSPVISPDGKWLLYTQMVRPNSFPRLVVTSLEESAASELVLNPGPVPMREARYSADGFWIAFESWPQGSNHDIYIMAASGAGRRLLTTDPREDFDAAWRPQPVEGALPLLSPTPTP